MKKILHVGLDVGSTTVKIVVMNNKLENLYTDYTRHHSDTKNTICKVLSKLAKDFPNSTYTMALTGSGALEISKTGQDICQIFVAVYGFLTLFDCHLQLCGCIFHDLVNMLIDGVNLALGGDKGGHREFLSGQAYYIIG